MKSLVFGATELWMLNAIVSLIDWLMDWLIDWLIGWLVDWLIDWMIDWLIDWTIERLIDCLLFGWLVVCCLLCVVGPCSLFDRLFVASCECVGCWLLVVLLVVFFSVVVGLAWLYSFNYAYVLHGWWESIRKIRVCKNRQTSWCETTT